MDTSSNDIDQQIALNFKTSYHIVRPLLDYFEKNGGGQFILTGARPALLPAAAKGMVAYSLAKSLVFHLAEIINASGKGKGISATVIVPSTIDTPANRKAMPNADVGKWVKPSDIAASIDYVLSSPGRALRDSVLKLYNEA
jgi:NAD(P)-dependent dehydrogenase (short-subunit alcohol dehydrogenase family)